ncbi:carboxy terminal-processing peptidase [Pseudoflavitalea rhizosphaerae]|uniref:carboxy terminal-processing peptidase n=1 Tax=Pseudoflavitalea rhizosphaerae TaxID=1884793 RepID=UPI000F8D7F19|nr:carboxy terminal-processing peptidase [Pseudoflavitalea rhizosphaerae]
MVYFQHSRAALMAGFMFFGAGLSGQAQTSKDTISADGLRKGIVKAVAQKLQKSHYAPKAFDDKFSAEIWDNFLHNLDGRRNIFLAGDIENLKKHRSLLDDEINAGTIAFFDETWKIYSRRLQEAKIFVEKSLKQPFSFTSKEILETERKDSPYPATVAERDKIWYAFLKYAVLRAYTDIETNASSASIDPVLEKKARENVAAQYRRFFITQQKETAINEKFAMYVNAIALNMDPHTSYTYPTMKDPVRAQLSGQYFGIGMELGIGEMDVFVKRLLPGGSAYKSGLLKENDRILAVIDNKGKMVPTADLDPNDITGMIRGEEGTSVTMLVMQPGSPERTVTIPREKISEVANKAKSAVINQNGKKIGYLYLPLFYMNSGNEQLPGCSADVAAELDKLRDQEVEGIVFDLRGNGGGSLTEVVRMGASFMPATPMSLLRSRDKVDVYTSPVVNAPKFQGPLVVLVDEGSASASEIFAAAIQDHQRGLVIGTSSSFGKGTAQTMTNIGKMGDPANGIPDINYGSMRITLQKFYRASGATTQLQGVKPDVVLADRLVLNSVREIEMPAAMPVDTLTVAKAPEKFNTIDYAPLIRKAQQRANENSTLQVIGKNMSRLQFLQKAPVNMELSSYRKLKQEMKDLEQQIAKAKELPASGMQLSASFYMNINPELQKKDEYQEKLYNNWLESLSKDLFLSEAVQLVQDMIKAPQIKK